MKNGLTAFNSLTANDYQQAAMRTYGIEKGKVTETDLSMLMNGLMGLNGEAGECIDILKKTMFQGHDFSRDHMAKELGDVAWYLAICAESIGYDLDTVLRMNVDKLLKRYPDGFDADKSVNRKPGDI